MDPITPEYKKNITEKIALVSAEAWGRLFDLGRYARNKKALVSAAYIPFQEETEHVMSIKKMLYDLELVEPFDWPEWDEGRELLNDPSKEDLKAQDLPVLFALLIALVRNDRFCEGAWGCAVGDGTVSDILDAIEDRLEL